MKIRYKDFLQKTSLTKEELLAFSWGTLIEDLPPEGCHVLPAPPLLMLDRVIEVTHDGNRGRIVGERDIALDDWFFQCHFRVDPVQPGCLGVDAIWQLMGVYASLCGARGAGRALGAKEIAFFGQIRPHNKLVRYEVEIRRYLQNMESGASFAVGSGTIFVDGDAIYTVQDAKIGLFKGIQYSAYPHKIGHALGGQTDRQ